MFGMFWVGGLKETILQEKYDNSFPISRKIVKLAKKTENLVTLLF